MRKRILWPTVGALLAVSLRAGPAGADTGHTRMTLLDDRGKVVHVVPRPHRSVRMVREKVVMVPFLDAGQPRMWVNVWYDFAETKTPAPASQTLPVGFPELKASFEKTVTLSGGAGGYGHPDVSKQSRPSVPTIVAFAARAGERWLDVAVHRGLGRYRRWFHYGLPLQETRPTRVHNYYVAHLGESRSSTMGAHVSAARFNRHWFTYLLHTGATWHGPIGEGSVWVWDGGGLRKVKAFKSLKPTLADDVHLSLDIAKLVGLKDHLDRDTRLRILPSRLVHSDSYRGAKPLPHYPALAADGDPGTWWIAGKTGELHYLQVPAAEMGWPSTLRITLPPASAGAARPSTIQVSCIHQPRPKMEDPSSGPHGRDGDDGGEDLSGVEPPWPSERTRDLGVWRLPDTAGPHVFKVPGMEKEPQSEKEMKARMQQRCSALRLTFLSTHGQGEPGIAEIELDPGSAPTSQHVSVTQPEKPEPRPRPGAKAAADPVSALRFAPAGDEGLPAFEKVGVSDVRFSGDGTLAHYRLWLEDERRKPARAVVLGYFVDVATGAVRRTYRVDRAGELPEPYATEWERGLGFLEAVDVLKRGAFVKVRGERYAPRRSVIKGLRLELEATLDRKRGLLRLRPQRWGWQWWYQPNKHTPPAPARGALALVAHGVTRDGKAPTTLLTHAPFLDQEAARAHDEAREKRRVLFVKAIEGLTGHQYAYEALDPEKDGRRWWQATYTRIHAFDGEVRVYYHPAGEAAVVVRVDRRELSGRLPDPKPEDLVPDCKSVCPEERRDYGLYRARASVHAFVPKKETTLLAKWTPPPVAPKPTAQTPGTAPETLKPATTAMKAAKPDGTKGGKKQGCGCDAGGSGTPLALLIPLLLVVLSPMEPRQARTSRTRR